MEYIRWFNEINASDVNLVGGKGANLGEMIGSGLPVPPGFCLTAHSYRDFIEATGLNQTFSEILGDIDMDDPADVEARTARIRALITGQTIPLIITQQILSSYRLRGQELGSSAPVSVAVRSSAAAEFLPDASFAGQQDTYLNIRGEEALLEHVKRCWASLWTARATTYRVRQGFDHYKVYLAVVVQAMIESEISGIMFTADPVSGDRDVMVINASWGLGEAIVSGLVSPDTLSVRKTDGEILSKHIAVKQRTIEYAPDGGILELETLPERCQAAALSDEQALELTTLGCKIEEHYGAPQDIEWAFARERLYILQARPITTLALAEGAAIPAVEYNRTMFVEIFPDPLTPCFYSVIQPLFHSMLDFTFKAWGFNPPQDMQAVGIYYNQPYFNRNYIETSFAPLSSATRDPLVAQIVNPFGDHKSGSQVELSLPYLRMAVSTMRFLMDFPKILPGLLSSYHVDVDQANLLSVEARSDRELVDTMLRLIYGPTKKLMDYDFLLIAVIKRVYHLLGKMLEPYFGVEADELRGKLISGVTGNATMETNIHLWNLAQTAKASPEVSARLRHYDGEQLLAGLEETTEGRAFLDELDHFLAEFGHREVRLDILFPTWCEDPAPVLNFVRSYLDVGEEQSPCLQQERLIRQRQLLTEKVRSRLAQDPRGRYLVWPLFRWLLEHIEFHTRERDTMHFEMTRLFPSFRRMLFELGRRWSQNGLIAEPGDIFFLRLDEMEVIAETPAPMQETIRIRQEEYELNKGRPWPDIIKGDQEVYAEGVSVTADSLGQLKGVSGSPGCVTGQARVIQGPEEFHRLQKGDILVAPITNPVWTPLFAIASGVVTEVGGILSHGAIVAREYGIPAVMSLAGATRCVPDGQIITVDGNKGVVYLVEAGA